jgi:hypothetical protein
MCIEISIVLYPTHIVPITAAACQCNAMTISTKQEKQRRVMREAGRLPRRPDDEIDELLDHGARLLCDAAGSYGVGVGGLQALTVSTPAAPASLPLGIPPRPPARTRPSPPRALQQSPGVPASAGARVVGSARELAAAPRARRIRRGCRRPEARDSRREPRNPAGRAASGRWRWVGSGSRRWEEGRSNSRGKMEDGNESRRNRGNKIEIVFISANTESCTSTVCVLPYTCSSWTGRII